jgi:hypothetical protein
MGTLNQTVPTAGPLTAAQLTDEINTELAELYKRSFAKVGNAAGTNAYTGSIPLNRPLEDANGFIFVVPNANTGPCTFNGLPLVTNQGAALQAGQLSTGMVIAFIYNQPSNDYRVLTPLFGGTAPIVRVYSSPGTFIWTKTSGLVAILVEQQAPGGGGGYSGGSGAGSGSYGRRLIAASLLPPTVSIVNGSPGVGGTASSTAGSNGGNSSFGAFLTTNGGARGLGSVGSNAGGAGGAAGTGGDVNEAGRAARSSQFSPEGAPSPSGGAGGLSENSSIQYPATLGGGGSAGVPGASNGGAGGPGRTSVTEYYS